MLADGRYDVVIVDASEADVSEHPAGSLALDLAIAAGEHRGELVTVVATGLTDRDPLDLLAVPATLTVAGGEPSVILDA